MSLEKPSMQLRYVLPGGELTPAFIQLLAPLFDLVEAQRVQIADLEARVTVLEP